MELHTKGRSIWIGIFLLICGIALFCGCSRSGEPGNRYTGSDQEMMGQVIEDFITAMDARDPDAIKEMLCSNMRESENVDELIQELFDFYPGHTEGNDWDGKPPSSSYSKGQGYRYYQIGEEITLFSEDAAYYCYLELRCRDSDEGGIGVRRICMASEKVRCSEDFTWPQEAGIYVFTDADGDYLTRRVGGSPIIYTPMERMISEDDILDFISETTDFGDFSDKFGIPNGEKLYGLCPVYELCPVDGEIRYAVFMLEYVEDTDRWRIEYIEIKSTEDFLYYLWSADEQ